MLIDLQLHSTFSDGYLSPSELVDFAKERSIKVISLTDHHTTAGLEEFRQAAKRANIKTIDGVELYLKYRGRGFNAVWYNFSLNNEKLERVLSDVRRRRIILVRRSLKRLKEAGYKIDIEKILSSFDNYIPVNRLAEMVMSDKHNYDLVVKSLRAKTPKGTRLILPLREESVLSELFFNRKRGVLKEAYISAERIVKIKAEVGGQIVFAHPGKYNKYTNTMTERLQKIGLIDGIEVLSPHHNIGAIMYSQFLAEKLDLIATGGSDFHLFEKMFLLMMLGIGLKLMINI